MKGDICGDRLIRDGSQDKKEDNVAGDYGWHAVVNEDIEVS